MMVNVTIILELKTEMPTSGDLKSGDPVSNYPTPLPQEKGDKTSSPTNQPPCPQINLELPMFTLTLQHERRKKISEVFQGVSSPKVELKSSEDFPMLAQRIRKVS